MGVIQGSIKQKTLQPFIKRFWRVSSSSLHQLLIFSLINVCALPEYLIVSYVLLRFCVP
jgi:hypothetical protein